MLLTVGENARSSKTKMYKQKSDELSIITIRYMHKAKKTTPVPDLFLKLTTFLGAPASNAGATLVL